LLKDYSNGHYQPIVDDSFPALTLFPDFKNCTGLLKTVRVQRVSYKCI